jgi:hypothetical protein
MKEALLVIGIVLNLIGSIMLGANAFYTRRQVIKAGISRVTVVKPEHKTNSIEKPLKMLLLTTQEQGWRL